MLVVVIYVSFNDVVSRWEHMLSNVRMVKVLERVCK
jgi:hypothetical protein